MKFSIGYQDNEDLKKSIIKNSSSILELYFPWGKFTSGRGVQGDIYSQFKLERDLNDFAQHNIKFNLLLNGNCYGRNALGRKFFQEIGDSIDYISNKYSLQAITTTSPVIAKFIKNNFPELKIKASVNMEIGSIEGIEYLLPYFDGFYLKRELNYSPAQIKLIYDYCKQEGKELFLIANSGCLNYCSARTFHDNLVAHQHEIEEMDNAFVFKSQCQEFLEQNEKKAQLLRHTNFIRPENINFYNAMCDGMKIATRTNRNPAMVLNAYVANHHSGNLLDLSEPSHSQSIYPEIVDNSKIDNQYFEHRINCQKNCSQCHYCDQVQEKATLNLKYYEGIKKC